MLKLVREKFVTATAAILVFTIVVFTGCSSSSSIETIEAKNLVKECDNIPVILSFKLKNGETYNTDSSFVYFECGDSTSTKLVYESTKKNSLNQEKIFKLSEILNVKVLYPKDDSNIGVIVLGGLVFIGIMALIVVSSDKSGRP